MAEWQEPVFDRTQADVDYARKQLENKANDVDYKGCFNRNDLLRIERNTLYLEEVLTNLYYITRVNRGAMPASNGIIYKSSIDRIINNVNILWEAYHKPANAVALPNTLLTFSHVNALEKNHFLINETIENMVGSFKECNTFSCGEE